jgi:hypothetical protein
LANKGRPSRPYPAFAPTKRQWNLKEPKDLGKPASVIGVLLFPRQEGLKLFE